MPPKASPNDPQLQQLAASFKRFGLSDAQALDAARNHKIAPVLTGLVESLLPPDRPSALPTPKQAALILQWATGAGRLDPAKRAYGAEAILDGRLATAVQTDAALKHLQAIQGDSVDAGAFDEACGVGVTVTRDQAFARVRELVAASEQAQQQRWAAHARTVGDLKRDSTLRWAAPLDVKDAVDAAFVEAFGPKPPPVAGGKAAGAAPKDKDKGKGAEKAKPEEPAPTTSMFEVGLLGSLYKPGGNEQTDPALMEAHLRATGGKVVTRFPPEPNGYLHIGHSKAIAINFGYAAHHNGICYLRYDDTNPEGEKQEYYDSILDTVRWLGFEPYRITYSSDHFQRLYDLAVELIKRGKAYVCFCTNEEIKANRGLKSESPKACVHRTLPIPDSLEAFAKMKDGGYKAKEAVLRMKQNLEDGNPQMWDLIAYRVYDDERRHHHRTGLAWRIYPTYDFTHCLCDSFENISHSLCTTEFIASRVSYEWLCHALDVYTPRQTEYGRLNLEGTVMSKRKIMKLVEQGHVEGWDDPRLYTLIALRRRGVPPEAIISFVGGLGASTALSNTSIHRFEQSVRSHLELTTPRLMMVLDPLKITIDNLAEDFVLFVERSLHPKVPSMGSVKAPFTRHVYIDRSDFRAQASKDFFRLVPGGCVGLLNVPRPVTCVAVKTDPATGEPVELVCRYEDGPSPPKPKAYVQWVAVHAASRSPLAVDETRIYKRLFKSANPALLPDFLADIDPNSLEVVRGALIEVGFWSVARAALEEAEKRAAEAKARAEASEGREGGASKEQDDGEGASARAAKRVIGNECVRFQGMRTAYFALDKTAVVERLGDKPEEGEGATGLEKAGSDKLVLNWIVSLKDDPGRNQ